MGAALLACTFLLAATWTRRGSAQLSSASVDELKVAYTFHFLELIEWKAEGPSLEFCAYTSSAVGDEMMNTFRNRKIRKMQITTRRSGRDDPHVDRCKAMFIPESSADEVSALLRRLQNAQTVTVSSLPDFVDAGGIIGFVIVGDRLRFDINEAAAAKHGLKISARLLELAHRVVR
jgi:hypothetical protein